jgi:S1-C subfamily serine protease
MKKKVLFPVALLVVSVLVLSGCSAPAASLGTFVAEMLPSQVETADTIAPAAQAAAPSSPSPASANTILDAVEATLDQIYTKVTPSVVNIQVVQNGDSTIAGQPAIPGFPSDPSMPGQPFQQQGLGSGFVWDKEGHIVTNNHVVAGADRITVTFHDGLTVGGEVVGADPHSDLAVVRVDVPASQLQPVEVADSTEVKVGQLAVAIGNPFGLEGTMTVGFISALGRSLPVNGGSLLGSSYTIPDIIQTDAPINPGNSGGVLVDDGGRVIGVPTAIESPVQANAGIGFAVPAVIVQKVVPVLIESGRYEHPWLGVSGTSMNSVLAEAMDLDSAQRGVLVAEVVDNSPASEAELQGSDRQVTLDGREVQVGGDVIIAINDQPVRDFDDLVTYLVRNTNVGQTVSLTILRDGREQTVNVTLAVRPTEEQPQVQAQARPRQGTAGNAWLGIQGLTLSPELAAGMELDSGQEGVLVAEVVQDSPADDAGLRGGDQVVDIDGQRVAVGGDIIVAVDGEAVQGMEDLLAFMQGAEPGQEVSLTILRDGEEMTMDVTLSQR